jgi:hypothetical protein
VILQSFAMDDQNLDGLKRFLKRQPVDDDHLLLSRAPTLKLLIKLCKQNLLLPMTIYIYLFLSYNFKFLIDFILTLILGDT